MVESVNLFDVAAKQARWLSVRQSVVAGNIANVNTPGYASFDVEPFEKVVANRTVTLASTAPGHVSIGNTQGIDIRRQDVPNMLPSENSVSMEKELMKVGEVRRDFELNTAIVKAFHRMLMSTVRA